MTEDPHGQEYLDLFKPKADTPADDATLRPDGSASSPQRPVSSSGTPGATQPTQRADARSAPPAHEDWDAPAPAGHAGGARVEAQFGPAPATPGGSGFSLRTVVLVGGAGCLLLLLTAVVVFAFFQVFVRRGGEDGAGTSTPTQLAALTPSPFVPIAESPLVVPLVSSGDVRVPVALPERLVISGTVFTVQAVDTPAGSWPSVPVTGDTVNWAYGSVVNYILGLAPTAENRELLSALQVGDALSLRMSTGITLNFNVDEVVAGATEEAVLLRQVSPRLTLALLADDPAQRTVVTAAFFDDEAAESELPPGAVMGVVGTPVDQGPARVKVIEAYQVAGDAAGLPPGTGYLLIDLSVENVGTQVLDAEYFQTFVSDATGGRYPLTLLAEQFAHHGTPTDVLAPGETVIGSFGYLVPDSSEGQVRWAFNPLPGSDNWVIVPIPYDLPSPPLTSEPTLLPGFARVSVDPNDVFVDRDDSLLIVGVVIENISDGEVVVTAEDVSLSSFPDGEVLLVSAGPPLPWTIEPGESKRVELQFDLPTSNDALLDVLGYSFSIDNIGGE
jgi:hypothetical protein